MPAQADASYLPAPESRERGPGVPQGRVIECASDPCPAALLPPCPSWQRRCCDARASLVSGSLPRRRHLAWSDSSVYPGTVRDWWVYVPAQYDADPSQPAALIVCQVWVGTSPHPICLCVH